MTWVTILLTILGAAVWFVNGIRQIGAVSVGDPIDDRSGSALLLIDLQTVFWESDTFNEAVKADAKTQILAEVNVARSNKVPVIAIRQEWSIPSTKAVARLLMKGQAVKGTSGTELATSFKNCLLYTSPSPRDRG